MLLFSIDNSTTFMGYPIRHGSTVAFQSIIRYSWLGCSTTTTSCANSACPGLYMRGNDWNSCSQNVFQIFRAKGHGDVRVGDLISLYYKREGGNWFGCRETLCAKNTCPGIASYEHGLNCGIVAMHQSSRFTLMRNSWETQSMTKMTSCCSTFNN